VYAVEVDRPFRGSAAVAAGLVTRDCLFGPRFRRLFPDVYVPADREPNLALRSRAAAVYVGEHGVLVGYSAAELLDASCAPQDAPAEVTVPDGRRSRPGLVVHRFRPLPAEVDLCDGVRVTTPLRTAFDLARRPDRTEAIVAIDALARGRFAPEELLRLAAAHRGDRGLAALRRAVALADSRSGSPMETRIRVAIHRYGLPAPELQFPVGPYLLDLAYPKIRLAVEYDGRDHRTADRALRDLHRESYLTRRGWDVLRLRASVVHDPREVAVRVHRELFVRGAASGSPVGSQPHW
jgi:very-short-patch-repair endonuclease